MFESVDIGPAVAFSFFSIFCFNRHLTTRNTPVPVPGLNEHAVDILFFVYVLVCLFFLLLSRCEGRGIVFERVDVGPTGGGRFCSIVFSTIT